MAGCTVVRAGDSYAGKQGLDYGAGIAAESSEARAICLHRLTMPPGARARAHLHEHHESAIYVISGRAEFWWGAAAAPRARRPAAPAAAVTSAR